LYPEKVFELGAKNAVVYIKVVRYRGGKLQDIWNFNNDAFKDSFTALLVEMAKVKSSFTWLDFAVGQMKFVPVRDFPNGPNVQQKRPGNHPVTALSTYVPFADNEHETKERFHTLAEIVGSFLNQEMFKNMYFENASQKLAKYWDGEMDELLNDLQIEIGTMKTLRDKFMDEYVKDAVHYSFLLPESLILRPIEEFPEYALNL
jgi:hypothetical protein